MYNYKGHISVIDFGDATISDTPKENFRLKLTHLILLRELWKGELFGGLEEYRIPAEREKEVKERPYGKFILALFEREEKNGRESKDLNDMLNLLNDLLNKNNHARQITFETNE